MRETEMRKNIYKILESKDFISLGKNSINHADIIKAFERKESKHYVEIYKEFWGYSLQIYGYGFMIRNHPQTFSIIEENDLNKLTEIITSKIY